jgi:hypothetical protein
MVYNVDITSFCIKNTGAISALAMIGAHPSLTVSGQPARRSEAF